MKNSLIIFRYCLLYLRPSNKYQEKSDILYKILGNSHSFKLEVVQKTQGFQEEIRRSCWRPLKKDVCEDDEINDEKNKKNGELDENQIENFFKELELLKTDR